jgi:DNA-binding transcriptional regulator YiaG
MNDIDVRKIRSELGLSQDELAEKVGVSIRMVQNWESGKVIPKSKYAILRNLIDNPMLKAALQPSFRQEGTIRY